MTARGTRHSLNAEHGYPGFLFDRAVSKRRHIKIEGPPPIPRSHVVRKSAVVVVSRGPSVLHPMTHKNIMPKRRSQTPQVCREQGSSRNRCCNYTFSSLLKQNSDARASQQKHQSPHWQKQRFPPTARNSDSAVLQLLSAKPTSAQNVSSYQRRSVCWPWSPADPPRFHTPPLSPKAAMRTANTSQIAPCSAAESLKVANQSAYLRSSCGHRVA